MPEYLPPGVYVEEIERGPRPIEGVPTSTAAFLGEAERGPTKPRAITSYQEYKRWFGGTFGLDHLLRYATHGFFENGGQRLFVCRIVGDAATSAEATFGNFTIRAAGPGSWGNRVWVSIDASSTTKPDPGGTPTPAGFRLRVAYWSTPPAQIFDPFAEPNQMPRPFPTEVFDTLGTDPKSPDYYGTRLRGSSALVTLEPPANATASETPAFGVQMLTNGSDDPAGIDVGDFKGDVVPDKAQGLAALELDPCREVALIYAPNAAVDVAKAVIDHCERLKYRFAVIDCDKGKSDLASLDPRTTHADTAYAAFYSPWIMVSDPETGGRKVVPPGGHVLGIFARTDIERGVFKAPTNASVRGALELEFEFDITDASQGILNSRGVNVVRRFPGRGIRVWGARTMSSNALWKYVSVRRLLIFLEQSIYEGTQWVVFEPNDDRLWAHVADTIRLFLREQWRLGALLGRTEQEAFFVKCDRTTMTQDDILNGRLICEIGIAPIRPAEFVVLRIFQHTA